MNFASSFLFGRQTILKFILLGGTQYRIQAKLGEGSFAKVFHLEIDDLMMSVNGSGSASDSIVAKVGHQMVLFS